MEFFLMLPFTRFQDQHFFKMKWHIFINALMYKNNININVTLMYKKIKNKCILKKKKTKSTIQTI